MSGWCRRSMKDPISSVETVSESMVLAKPQGKSAAASYRLSIFTNYSLARIVTWLKMV